MMSGSLESELGSWVEERESRSITKEKRRTEQGKGEEGRGSGKGLPGQRSKGGRRVFLDFLAAFAAGGVGEPLGNAIYCQ